jgi:hypothetical protein
MGRCDRSAPHPAAGSVRARGRGLGFAAVAALAGCGSSGGTHPDAGGVEELMVWHPKTGDAPNWDIQLADPIDVSAVRTMYDLDLWSLVPVDTVLDYGDGKPVTVKAGKRAGAIAQLHARTPPAIVICHVETGAIDVQRPEPDVDKFLSAMDRTRIPDSPDPPNPDSLIGWRVGEPGAPGLRYLDIREASRAKLNPILFKRFELAQQIGCDGIDPAHNDSVSYNVPEVTLPGFPILSVDSLSWYAEVAKQGHARKLSTGMRNGTLLPGQSDVGAQQFDWLILERCGEFELGGTEGCDTVRPFLQANKDVFAIEYDKSQDGTMDQDAAGVCAPQTMETIDDGLFKHFPPSSDAAIRRQCKTPTP